MVDVKSDIHPTVGPPESVRPAPSVASEELARRSSTEKAELAVANEHFSVGLQRQIERSSSDQIPKQKQT
ncbi:hypothetical protein ACQKEK_17645 [Pseudomonas sp. NPDC077408]